MTGDCAPEFPTSGVEAYDASLLMRLPAVTRPLIAFLAVTLLPLSAVAREYSTEIDVADEKELRQLYYDGLLEDDEFDILLRLLEAPIDLNRAERGDLIQLPGVTQALANAIVEERTADGSYLLLADLASRVDALTMEDIRRFDSFVYLRVPSGTKPAFKGKLDVLVFKDFDGYRLLENDYPARSRSIRQAGYGKGPAVGYGVQATILQWLDVGIAGVAQEGIRSIQYEPSSRDLYASWGTPTLRPYLGYARAVRPEGEVVVGTYHLSYGLGLVMNTIGGRERHGPSLRKSFGRSSDRIRQFDGLLGGAARLLALKAGRFQFDLSAFGSIRDYDTYSNYIGLAEGEILDPVDSETLTPRVWVEGNKVSYLTIPNAIRVALAGGNATLRFNRRTHVGFTGYAALSDRTVIDGIPDDAQNELLFRRRWPVANNFGAIGVNGAVGFGLINMAAEWALHIDQRPGNGLRFLFEVEPAWGEFVISLRHYDTTFANPYARSQAAPDSVGGLRARNEQGVRLQATVHPIKSIRANVRIDLAHNIQYDIYDLEVRGSVRGKPVPWLGLQLFASIKNQDLALNGREFTYGGEIDEELFGFQGEFREFLDDSSIDCDEAGGASCERAGEKATFGGQIKFQDKKIGSIGVRYRHAWTDNDKTLFVNENSCRLARQESGTLRVFGRVRPHKWTTISGSFYYLDEDLWGFNRLGTGSEQGSHGLGGWMQIEQKIKDTIKLRLRGSVGRRLPEVSSRCDEGGATPGISGVSYLPADHDEHFGDLLFSLRVKF